MNIVFVQHFTGPEYAFAVPEELVPYVRKGVLAVVETMRGVDVGEVKTDIISGPGALDVAKQRGAYEPLKNVIGIDYPILQRVFYNKADRALRDKFGI
jgi:hypothetical protein